MHLELNSRLIPHVVIFSASLYMYIFVCAHVCVMFGSVSVYVFARVYIFVYVFVGICVKLDSL